MKEVVDWKVKKGISLPKGLKKADDMNITFNRVEIIKGKDSYVIPLENFEYIKYAKVEE